MAERLRVTSPVDGSVYLERELAGETEIRAALAEARHAQAAWKGVPVAERAALAGRFVDAMLAMGEEIAPELTWQMGRPVTQNPNELRGFEERARHMIEIAEGALADVPTEDKENFRRFIRREPLGVVLVIAAWNYPYLIAVNAVVPAIMAGNAVVLKHSAQTPRCAERFAEAFDAAGLPDGVFQVLHMSHAGTEQAIADANVDFVAFTGSVAGGRAVQAAASKRFIATGLELGGKDPAYVRSDCDFAATVDNLVDGAFYNSGQSCCAIERIYVHEAVYDDFVEAFVETVRGYRLGNPLEPETTLGPLVRTAAADFVREQVADAVAKGARALVDADGFPADAVGTPYLAPQVLVDVDHSMRLMTEETFGPAIGIMKVASDEEAITLMNDSDFGLTASIWTADDEAALSLGSQVETGTWFQNRCDYLDPALAWVGVKESGRGCSLSALGYEQLTRPKSFHLRTRF
ncbi:MAG: aldehyde dehydrogenase family protein [Alphaproteobacteria bacterium]|jgi:acyl-CoA reductase-like NAD-dependent aldehyde dehydrogenase|nr:aldehyde dehydrogenase family protein [Alphaproteobacteria bacterium]